MDDNINHNKTQSPQKTGVHQSPVEDEKPSKLEQKTHESYLRRYKRMRKPNLRNANTVVVGEEEIKQFETFEKEAKNSHWKKSLY